MTPTPLFDRLGALARRLPFRVEDFDAVNGLYGRWMRHRADEDLETLEMWLYCYAQRYVLTRLVRAPRLGRGEADRVVGEAFERTRARLDAVIDPEHFAQWASVTCKRAFLNGLRRCSEADLPEDYALCDPGTEPALADLDRAIVRHAVARAVERLPGGLRAVARLRFLEGRSYEQIATVTGHELPTIRTYAARSAGRLRRDASLRTLVETLDLVPL